MANVCSRCSTDNADGALVCRQCGAALASPAGWSRSLLPEDDNFDPLSAPTLVMQHTAPAALPALEETMPAGPEPGTTGRRLVWGLLAFAALLLAGMWLLRPAQKSAELAAQPLATPAAAVASQPAASTPVVAAPAASQRIAPPEPLASAPAAAPAAAAAVVAEPPATAAAPASAVDRRKRIPEPVMRRPVPASAPAATVAEPAPPAVAPAAATPAAEPPRAKSVSELCSGSNLLTRGFCEHRECGKAEHAGDAVCLRLKETEEARRLRK